MKRMLLTIAAIMATVLPMCAQGIANISVEARFITDKMITELRLAPSLYGTLLNLNGTYLRAIGGHRDIGARCWHERNSALKRILSRAQWKAYRAAECFYRPIGWDGEHTYTACTSVTATHTCCRPGATATRTWGHGLPSQGTTTAGTRAGRTTRAATTRDTRTCAAIAADPSRHGAAAASSVIMASMVPMQPPRRGRQLR